MENINDICRSKVDKTCVDLNQEFATVCNSLQEIGVVLTCDDSPQWKHLYLSCYLLKMLEVNLTDNDILSVQEANKLKGVFQNICQLGIFCNLQPNLPLYRKLDDDDLVTSESPELIRYHRLINTLNALVSFVKCLHFRSLIIPQFLKPILAALYQIIYCPLKKPSSTSDASNFVMTKEMYESLLKDRESFKQHFEYLKLSVYRPIYVRETMLLVSNKTPTWFKNAVSSNLSLILRSKNGVQSVAAAMLDGTTNDNTKIWSALDVIAKLVVSCKASLDFRENVCQQVIDLLQSQDASSHTNTTLFERVFIVCTKKLYTSDSALCEQTFVNHIVEMVQALSLKTAVADGEDITKISNQAVRIYYACFVEHSIDSPVLPIELLQPIIIVLFRIYIITLDSALKSINRELQEILLKFIKQCDQSKLFLLFDACIFGILQKEWPDLKDLQFILKDNSIIIKYNDYNEYSTEECGNGIMTLIKDNSRALSILFSYLLNCLIDQDKYFKDDSSKELLACETHGFLTESIKRKLVVFQLLSNLAEDKVVQKYINNTPSDIIKYIQVILNKTIDTNMHKTSEYESSGFQTIFTLVMILQALVNGCSQENFKFFQTLVHPLRIMQSETSSEELKDLVTQILNCLTGAASQSKNYEKEITEVDKAIEDICDPLLPIRGHGLMTLTKLVEKKDEHAMERKQYILNIFQVDTQSLL